MPSSSRNVAPTEEKRVPLTITEPNPETVPEKTAGPDVLVELDEPPPPPPQAETSNALARAKAVGLKIENGWFMFVVVQSEVVVKRQQRFGRR